MLHRMNVFMCLCCACYTYDQCFRVCSLICLMLLNLLNVVGWLCICRGDCLARLNLPLFVYVFICLINVYDNLWDDLTDNSTDNVWESLCDENWDNLWGNLWDIVWDNKCDIVWDNVCDDLFLGPCMGRCMGQRIRNVWDNLVNDL